MKRAGNKVLDRFNAKEMFFCGKRRKIIAGYYPAHRVITPETACSIYGSKLA